MRYVVTTPANPGYNGTTFHVKFQNGRAILDEANLPQRPDTQYTVEELARRFRTDVRGYVVEALVNEVPAAAIERRRGQPEEGPNDGGKAAIAGAGDLAPAKKPTKKTTKKTAGRQKVAED